MSKNVIFYFTGTGNSLKAARDIAGTIGECDMFLIPAYKEKTIPAGYERVGFVFPVYLSGPPVCVQKFLEEIDFSANKNAYVFTLATYGGAQGNTYYAVNKLLADKGVKLNAAFGVNMRPNYIVMYDMPEFVSFISRNYTKKIKAAAEKILKKEHTAIPEKESESSAERWKKFAGRCRDMDRDYNVSGECIGCGVCGKVCPVGNIVMKDGKPDFEHRCEQCMACIHACPKRALNYKDKTQKRKRYRNPDVALEDLYVSRD